ncbi:MAG: T9SS type A sorting domain-containing protein [Bacteroidota bacterium]|nr:T9SS type A sorting domain-containing protein [Bacteroidota bacterium]
MLTWVTASENNNDYFVIEKSRDGTTFFPIAKQESKGNSSTDTKYTLRDGEVSSGLTYYRMHQVDFDGTTTYFKTIVVNIGDFKEGYYVVYPNPTADMVTISRKGMPAHVQVNVYDLGGRMLISRTYNDLSRFEHPELDLTGLRAGVYQLMILSEDGPKIIRVRKE